MLSIEQVQELQAILPNKVSCSSAELAKHSNSLFYITQYSPDVVCYAESEEDVIQVVTFCIKNKAPLIPYGSGTSTEGHTAAVYGGVCLNLTRMNQILDFNLEDHLVTVEPGIAYNELNHYLHARGFHFPVEAGWGASIGGMVSTNASGAGAVDAGSMAKNVASCEIVVYQEGSAKKIITGTKALKSSSGYNLNNLFIGAEGTLGVITKVILRVRPNFQYKVTLSAQFSDIQTAIDFVIFMKGQIRFRRVELMDKLQTTDCIAYSKVDFLEQDAHTVLMELAGNQRAIEEEMELIVRCLKDKAKNIHIFKTESEINTVWMMRKNALPAVIHRDPTKKVINTDISVPLSKLTQCILKSYEIMEAEGISSPLVAHIGDGNFHFSVLVDPNNRHDLQIFHRANKKIIQEALKLGGTCSGEHGIGLGKTPYLHAEHGASVFTMSLIKKAFDPLGIFNPGKLL